MHKRRDISAPVTLPGIYHIWFHGLMLKLRRSIISVQILGISLGHHKQMKNSLKGYFLFCLVTIVFSHQTSIAQTGTDENSGHAAAPAPKHLASNTAAAAKPPAHKDDGNGKDEKDSKKAHHHHHHDKAKTRDHADHHHGGQKNGHHNNANSWKHHSHHAQKHHGLKRHHSDNSDSKLILVSVDEEQLEAKEVSKHYVQSPEGAKEHGQAHNCQKRSRHNHNHNHKACQAGTCQGARHHQGAKHQHHRKSKKQFHYTHEE